MRKILSGFLATAMVTSVCATMSFAAATVPATDGKATVIEVDLSSVALETEGQDAGGNDITFDETASVTTPKLTVEIVGGGSFDITATGDIKGGFDAAKIAKAFVGDTVAVSTPAPKYANGDAMTNADFQITASGSKVIITTKAKGAKTKYDVMAASVSPADSTKDATLGFLKSVGSASVVKDGSDPKNVTVDAQGTDALVANLRDIVVCGEDGNPIPLTEKDDGVDKDQNSADGVQSGQTVYFMIQEGAYKFDDDTYWKLKISKGDNGKYVKAISDVSKTFSNDLYSVYDHKRVEGTGGSRHRYIKCEMNEIFTDDEHKVTLDLRLTPKSKATDVFTAVDDDYELKVKDFFFYVKNIVKDADGDWEVGVGGLMLEPLENDWNEVTYYDEDGDLAFMKFFGDSDVGKFYAKLSTKWEHADYASYFNDQDAFIFNFTGSPKLSSTSRADLQIYNPFVDEDGNETIDPATATIYQVIDGDLFDVTDSFKYEEGDNGDMAFVTRTRFLGTYIICEKPVEEAASDETVPDTELTPDDDAGAPEETTPDNNGGGKAPANTGKYL